MLSNLSPKYQSAFRKMRFALSSNQIKYPDFRMMFLIALKDFFWLLFIPKTREYISADYQVK